MTAWGLTGLLLVTSSGLTVEALEARRRTETAAEVITGLFHDVAWGSIEDGIASGNPRWLKVAGPLYGGCDAGVCFSIKLALGEALLPDAAGVLAVIADGIPRSQACSTYGFLADSTEATREAILEAIRA